MPDSLMLYMVVTKINENIRFARWEQKGNEYQRPLEDLLEHLPEHCSLAGRIQEGSAQASELLGRKQDQIDAALAKLEAVDARIGADLQFTDEGLAKRKREHCRVSVLKEEWQALKKQLAQLSAEACAEQHRHLLADVRTMITHAGDLSNLILDPDLDTYYLMDVTLLALPQTQDRLAAVTTRGENALKRQAPSREDRVQLGTYAGLLKESDRDRVVSSAQTALNEDSNFYGASTSLQTRAPALLQEYKEATDAFMALTARLAESENGDITAEEYVLAGHKAREASFKLWRVALEEWAEVRIGDSGTGIPEHARARVFDPFFTTKGVGKDTGQGLAIAHSVIVDKHGGTLDFETETGKGTTFIIRLPLTPSVLAEAKRAA